MKESQVDLWWAPADLRVITTNGTVKSNGCAVMGRGCAREAADKWPYLPRRLGQLLIWHGNRPMRLINVPDCLALATLPVKHNWWECADLDLIEKSVILLVEMVDKFGYENVLIPRPGCGNGGLLWPAVKVVIEPLLDDRFTVVTK